ncbi:MAG: anti-sigma factor [Actinomycetota bacterium]|nr:anti-sigma factor [Actinomycetota bacterium]
MAMNVHERIEELVAAQALGGSSPGQDAELDQLWAEHGASCEQCRRMEVETHEVAGRLAFALVPSPVREGFEDQVMGRAFQPAVAVSRPGGPRRWLAAAAAAVLLFAGGLGGYLFAPRQNGQTAALAAFLAQGPRIVQFHGPGQGALTLAYRPGERSAFVVGSGLPTPPSGKVYELWTFRGNNPPAPSGTFTPSGTQAIVHLALDLSGANQMAVTVEQAPGAPQPTTTPVFVAPITA